MNQSNDWVDNELANSIQWLPVTAAFDPILACGWTHTPLGGVGRWLILPRADYGKHYDARPCWRGTFQSYVLKGICAEWV